MSAICRKSWPNMLAISTIGARIDRWDNGRPAHRKQARLIGALKLERSSRYLCSEAYITFISKPHDDVPDLILAPYNRRPVLPQRQATSAQQRCGRHASPLPSNKPPPGARLQSDPPPWRWRLAARSRKPSQHRQWPRPMSFNCPIPTRKQDSNVVVSFVRQPSQREAAGGAPVRCRFAFSGLSMQRDKREDLRKRV